MNIDRLLVQNPKRVTEGNSAEVNVFPYYAGYSKTFAKALLKSAEMQPGSTVLDPWNGAGTSTSASTELGLRSVGCDLNPVMIVVAKANLVSPLDASSLVPLGHEIWTKSLVAEPTVADSEPLSLWFSPQSTQTLRAVELSIRQVLIDPQGSGIGVRLIGVESLTPLAAIFYVALFRAVRKLAGSFNSSNPTWIKRPSSSSNRLRPSRNTILSAFFAELEALAYIVTKQEVLPSADSRRAKLVYADSRRLPLDDGEIDAVLTSPPYCTRIDYAVSTSIELAILGVGGEEFALVRRSLLGTSTVATLPLVTQPLGRTCADFLAAVKAHASKASAGYYYKSHLQYFLGLRESIVELARVTRPGGLCTLIVQDSYYKELHNDLPAITVETGSAVGMRLARRDDFRTTRSMVNVNSKSRKYVGTRQTTESVLCFIRE